jgi:hypothetical protein
VSSLIDSPIDFVQLDCWKVWFSWPKRWTLPYFGNTNQRKFTLDDTRRAATRSCHSCPVPTDSCLERRPWLAKHILAALASFCTHICRGFLHDLSHAAARASSVIRLCSDVKASTVTGVAGVTGVSETLFSVDVAAILALCRWLRHITKHPLGVERK